MTGRRATISHRKKKALPNGIKIGSQVWKLEMRKQEKFELSWIGKFGENTEKCVTEFNSTRRMAAVINQILDKLS